MLQYNVWDRCEDIRILIHKMYRVGVHVVYTGYCILYNRFCVRRGCRAEEEDSYQTSIINSIYNCENV